MLHVYVYIYDVANSLCTNVLCVCVYVCEGKRDRAVSRIKCKNHHRYKKINCVKIYQYELHLPLIIALMNCLMQYKSTNKRLC